MSNPLIASLSVRLRDLRGESSYAEFAARLGISKSLAYKMETSGEGTSLKTIYKVACALGIAVEDLLGADEIRKKRSRRG